MSIVVQHNRLLQAIGLGVIALSILAIAFVTNFAESLSPGISPASGNPSAKPGNHASALSSASGGSKDIVTIPFSAGRKNTLPEYYVPSSIKISTGDTVTWVNADTVIHTVTSVAFNSGQIWPKTSNSAFGPPTFSHTFQKRGVYSYFCQIHPYMSGTVYVDTEETQRRLTSTTSLDLENVMIEMPEDSAYHYKFDQGFFIPANAIVQAGSRITWVNHDYVAHTATATDGSFDTGVVDPRESKSLIVKDVGRIAYYCRIHPWMQASLTLSSPN